MVSYLKIKIESARKVMIKIRRSPKERRKVRGLESISEKQQFSTGGESEAQR